MRERRTGFTSAFRGFLLLPASFPSQSSRPAGRYCASTVHEAFAAWVFWVVGSERQRSRAWRQQLHTNFLWTRRRAVTGLAVYDSYRSYLHTYPSCGGLFSIRKDFELMGDPCGAQDQPPYRDVVAKVVRTPPHPSPPLPCPWSLAMHTRNRCFFANLWLWMKKTVHNVDYLILFSSTFLILSYHVGR